MKHLASKLTLLAGVLAVSCLCATPLLRADTPNVDSKAEKQALLKAKHDADVLKKYDKNGNGVLDPEELAKKQANEEKMKALREAKKRKAAERAQAGQAAPATAPTAVAPTPAPQSN